MENDEIKELLLIAANEEVELYTAPSAEVEEFLKSKKWSDFYSKLKSELQAKQKQRAFERLKKGMEGNSTELTKKQHDYLLLGSLASGTPTIPEIDLATTKLLTDEEFSERYKAYFGHKEEPALEEKEEPAKVIVLNKNRYWFWGAAASIVLLVGTFFLLRNTEDTGMQALLNEEFNKFYYESGKSSGQMGGTISVSNLCNFKRHLEENAGDTTTGFYEINSKELYVKRVFKKANHDYYILSDESGCEVEILSNPKIRELPKEGTKWLFISVTRKLIFYNGKFETVLFEQSKSSTVM
jgi:hypothetical protein